MTIVAPAMTSAQAAAWHALFQVHERHPSGWALVGTGLVGEERLAALDAESARLVALGATQFRRMLAGQVNESCIVMQDVEGNEFCLD